MVAFIRPYPGNVLDFLSQILIGFYFLQRVHAHINLPEKDIFKVQCSSISENNVLLP